MKSFSFILLATTLASICYSKLSFATDCMNVKGAYDRRVFWQIKRNLNDDPLKDYKLVVHQEVHSSMNDEKTSLNIESPFVFEKDSEEELFNERYTHLEFDQRNGRAHLKTEIPLEDLYSHLFTAFDYREDYPGKGLAMRALFRIISERPQNQVSVFLVNTKTGQRVIRTYHRDSAFMYKEGCEEGQWTYSVPAFHRNGSLVNSENPLYTSLSYLYIEINPL